MKNENLSENKEIVNKYRQLLRVSKWSREKGDITIIRKAFEKAMKSHNQMRRKSGFEASNHRVTVFKVQLKKLVLVILQFK